MEQELKCPFCGRVCKNNSGYLNHVRHCKNNPDKIDGPNKGKTFSDETKQKMSEASKKMWEDPTTRQKMIESQKIAMNRPEVRQKIGETQKKRYEDPTTRQKMSESIKRAWEDPDVRQKQSEAQKKRFEDPEYRQKQSDMCKRMWEDPEIKQKRYNTMKQNNSFNTSKIEEQLKNYFDSNNIDYKTQYKNELYPFMCDFYFPDKDLYVEIQGCWTHGFKPYDNEDEDCIKQLELWKSKNSKFYDNAIETWTVRDVKKRETAKINNLNWIEIFSIDLEECINIIQMHF